VVEGGGLLYAAVMEGQAVGDAYAKSHWGECLRVDVPLLMGKVETQIQLRVDIDRGSAAKRVNERVIAEVVIGRVGEGDDAFAAKHGEVRMNAVDGGLNFEAADVGFLTDSGAAGRSHTQFQGGLHNGTDEVGVVNADGVSDVVGGTVVGTEEGGLDKRGDLSAALRRIHGLGLCDSRRRQQYYEETSGLPD
jgi:hypothetical protein